MAETLEKIVGDFYLNPNNAKFEKNGDVPALTLVGEDGTTTRHDKVILVRNFPFQYEKEYVTVLDANAREIATTLCKGFTEGKYAKIGILYTRYISMMSQVAEVTDVLPLGAPEEDKTVDIVFEPGALEILDSAVPEYVAGRVFAAVRESFASEVAARRCAMDSAGKNAQEMIDTLQLEYNRARQGAITQEITEIVAGANA